MEIQTEDIEGTSQPNEINTCTDRCLQNENALTLMQNKIQELEREIVSLKGTISNLIQGRTTHRKLTMSVMKEEVKLLKYYTGFDNLDIFMKMYLYLTANETLSVSKKLKTDDQLLLVFCKLRQNFDFIDLAFRCSISKKLASTIFTKWINMMYTRLGSLNIWPSREVIFDHAPAVFQRNYPSTVLILDATELKVEKPSSLVLQSQSFSSYKSTNTLKGLVGCDPNGAVIFVSQLFLGNISDKKLMLKSGLYSVLSQKLESGYLLASDGIMVDKGYDINKEIKSLGLEVNIPPFASSNHQFETEDVLETRKIASCRVHVERSIRRIKCFKILREKSYCT